MTLNHDLIFIYHLSSNKSPHLVFSILFDDSYFLLFNIKAAIDSTHIITPTSNPLFTRIFWISNLPYFLAVKAATSPKRKTKDQGLLFIPSTILSLKVRL